MNVLLLLLVHQGQKVDNVGGKLLGKLLQVDLLNLEVINSGGYLVYSTKMKYTRDAIEESSDGGGEIQVKINGSLGELGRSAMAVAAVLGSSMVEVDGLYEVMGGDSIRFDHVLEAGNFFFNSLFFHMNHAYH